MSYTSDADQAGALPVAEIIERLREAYGAANETDLARAMGVPQSTLSSWKSRGSIPISALLVQAGKLDISLDWLIRGWRTGDEPRPGDPGQLDLEALGLALKIGLPRRALREDEFQDVANGIAALYLNFLTVLSEVKNRQTISRNEALEIIRNTASQFRGDVFKGLSRPSDQ